MHLIFIFFIIYAPKKTDSTSIKRDTKSGEGTEYFFQRMAAAEGLETQSKKSSLLKSVICKYCVVNKTMCAIHTHLQHYKHVSKHMETVPVFI